MKTKALQLLKRLLAGIVDLLAAGTVYVIAIHAARVNLNDINPALAIFSCLALWFLLIAPVLLATWGTTPGMWLAKIAIIRDQGSRFDLWAAYKRSLSVWAIGWGFGFFLPLTLMLFIANGIYFLNQGATIWDVYDHINTNYGKPGVLRIIALSTVILTVLITGLWSISQEEETIRYYQAVKFSN